MALPEDKCKDLAKNYPSRFLHICGGGRMLIWLSYSFNIMSSVNLLIDGPPMASSSNSQTRGCPWLHHLEQNICKSASVPRRSRKWQNHPASPPCSAWADVANHSSPHGSGSVDSTVDLPFRPKATGKDWMMKHGRRLYKRIHWIQEHTKQQKEETTTCISVGDDGSIKVQNLWQG